MTRHPLHPLAIVVAAVLAAVLAGCGSSSDDSAATAATGGGAATEASGGATTASTTATTTATTGASTGGGSAATTASTAAGSGAATVIEATVVGGKVTAAEDRFEVAKGTDVIIRVTADVEEPVHLHGYDIEADATPGQPAEISFTADIPGVFEVELEDSGTVLFEIEVK